MSGNVMRAPTIAAYGVRGREAGYGEAMQVLETDARAEALLAPVRRVIEAAAAPLNLRETLSVSVGDAAPWSMLSTTGLVLDSSLMGPGVCHEVDRAGLAPPVDRWRRAAALVLEALVTRALVNRTGATPQNDWRWVGLAAHVADALAPELLIGATDLAVALATGDLGANPRAGAAAWKAWRVRGEDPVERFVAWLDDGVVSAAEWRSLGAWVFDPTGLAALLPFPVERRTAESGLPFTLAPWSWALVRFEGGRSGLHPVLDGPGDLGDVWVIPDSQLTTVVGSAEGTTTVRAGDPVPFGEWVLASAEGAGQVFGARGVSFTFKKDGRFEAVLGDAFVGPLAALPVAEQVGTSGLVTARWQVAGATRLQLVGVDATALTLHGRRPDRFVLPARGLVLTEWLASLGDEPWSWALAHDRLVMRSRFRTMPVEVRFRKG